MADKLTELRAALEGLSIDGLRLVLRFAEFLKKQAGKG